MKEKMAGKIPVTFSKLEKHLQNQENSTDWVVAGAIVSKYIRTSQKGNQFACWTLSDLREGLKTVSVFLFGKAYKDLWKTGTHVVVAILNPNPLDNRKGSGDIAALSVLNSDQVMIWGQSKDLGVCRARKKNGEPCTSFVNKHQCDYCVYHVKQEYKKFAGRSELQASWGGGLNQLRNKVLGKNEVFYGGKSFTAVVAKPTTKQVKKDKTRLSQLFNMCESRLGMDSVSKQPAQRVQSNRVQLMKDAERLQSLTGSPATLASLSGQPNDQNISKPSTEQRIPKRISLQLEDSKVKRPFSSSGSPTVNTSLRSKLEKAVKKSEVNLNSSQDTAPNSLKIETHSKKAQSQKNCKKQPTKNRFESLTKLKSTSDRPKTPCVDKQNTLSKPKSKDKLEDLLDVSFDFDESEDNLLSLAMDNVESILEKKCLEKSKSNSAKEKDPKLLNREMPRQKLVSGPLSERISPTKHESMLNAKLKKENYEKPVSLSREGVSKNADCNERKPNDVVPIKSPKLTTFESLSSPKLTPFGSLSLTSSPRQSRAKENALKYVKLNGPINKDDPTKPKSKEISNKKRKERDGEENTKEDNTVMSKRFLDLMNATSKHLDLINNAENEAIDEYYDKMEKKEKMEEKMLNTFKIDCKAFKCLQCKYKWFSPSELCKTERHPIKVISAVKRFFQCQNCKNRTVSLEVIPLHNCSNCGSGNWIRAPMMREKKPTTVHLSIRGGEQKFTNSVVTDTNLDLLVPDDL